MKTYLCKPSLAGLSGYDYDVESIKFEMPDDATPEQIQSRSDEIAASLVSSYWEEVGQPEIGPVTCAPADPTVIKYVESMSEALEVRNRLLRKWLNVD